MTQIDWFVLVIGLSRAPRRSGVSVVVTVRQRAQSLSVRVRADHFLVSHHPGGGVIHLPTEGHTVKATKVTSATRALK